MTKRKTTLFREFIEEKEILKAPGAYDAITAKLIESMGFKAIFFSGGSASIASLGYPDIGLISFSEMLNIAKNVASAVDIPVFADGDNGYGNAINTMRTVKEYEAAGLVGIQLDDLNLPKKYSYPSKQVLPMEEVNGKLRAACDARKDPDFVIVFRTLARLYEGLDEAISRARSAAENGADMIFIDGIESEEELVRIRKEIDIPLLGNMNEKGFTSHYSSEDMETFGFNVCMYPVSLISSASQAMLDVLEEIRTKGTTRDVRDKMFLPKDLYDLAGLSAMAELEQQYLPPNPNGNKH